VSVTKDELIDFHRFALGKLASGDRELSWAELVGLWRLENPTPADQAEIRDAIREGLEDIAAGRYLPADQAMTELRAKHRIPRA